MANLPISLAISDYEHVRDLVSGEVRAEGLDITALRLPVEVFAPETLVFSRT